MARLFNHHSELDWSRAATVVAASMIIWTGLVSIIPERYHHIGTVILASIQSGVTFLMRSRKDRADEKVNQPQAAEQGSNKN